MYRATDLSGAAWWTNQFDTNSGALLAVISPTAETNRYVYDDLDNLKALGFGDQNWLTNFYNAENRLSGVRLPSSVAVTNFYDFAGRLTNRSSSIGESASFEYNGNDAVTVMTDNTGSTTNLYDAAGRLWGIDYPSGASVRYQLDVLDRIAAITNKATAGGTAYVTRYQYDPVGNVTNVIDPFNGNTSFEYDRVGRRTKRTLPNSVVSEWHYDWRDRVTNITHKIGSTNLASVLYERLAGGEPSKITREDGTYVELKYDSALRLTNEVYYTNTVAQTTNSYAYDASGSRIKLVKGPTTLTNAVTGGYRITEVKQGSTTVETYGYDNGGRVTTMTRDSKTWNLGYNTTDQLSAATNSTDSTWVTYLHDAAGRRMRSTNNASVVRHFLVAGTPGTDLESPLLIANASGSVQQGYVYLGDDPILRYTTGGTAAYYLEDGMGSVIGIAPAGSPNTANTTRLFYDGFGNTRGTNGPAPTIPSGAAGDFRFHGAWWEEGSGLYNMRAREYDTRMGRFTSRDPRNGVFHRAETLHAYVYALNNTHTSIDPSGEFTLLELLTVKSFNKAFQAGRAYAAHRVRQKVRDALTDAIKDLAERGLETFLPIDIPVLQGLNFEKAVRAAICGYLTVPAYFFFEVPITPLGIPGGPGITCNRVNEEGEMGGARSGIKDPTKYAWPDFIIGANPPNHKDGSRYDKTWVIGDIKRETKTLYDAYVAGSNNKQYSAIVNYARNHTFSRTAVFIVLKRSTSNQYKTTEAILRRQAAQAGVMAFIDTLYGGSKTKRR